MQMAMEPAKKKCCSCQQMLVPGDFYRSRRAVDGLATPCKQCRNKYAAANRDKQAAASRRWRLKYPDRNKASNRRQRERRKVERRAEARRWCEKNPEKYKLQRARYRQRHREELRQRIKKYRERNPVQRIIWRWRHREELRRRAKVYYALNSDEILRRLRERKSEKWIDKFSLVSIDNEHVADLAQFHVIVEDQQIDIDDLLNSLSDSERVACEEFMSEGTSIPPDVMGKIRLKLGAAKSPA